MTTRFLKLALLFCGLALLGRAAQDYDHEAIQYEKGPVSDPVSRLQARIDGGQTKLRYDEEFGYLPAVLDALGVPPESQILTFGKTSFQAARISPRRPRAIYFNDRVSVGFVRTGDVLEFASVDPRQGVVFYTLDQERSAHPRFVRRDTCLQCHQGNATLNVPGLVVRSIYPEPSGMPLFQAGGFITDYRSPLKDRWGGWYVTGTHGAQTHLGNAFAFDTQNPTALDTKNSYNLTSLKGRFNLEEYLRPTSDLVALMVIEHQTRLTNLLTRANWETRKAIHYRQTMAEALGSLSEETRSSAERRIRAACDELVEGLLLVDEAPLSAPVRGVSGFAEAYARPGPADPQGRSLRQLDLQRRLFRYPCSPLIYSEAFDNLPPEALEYVYRRLWDILGGRTPDARFAKLAAADRQAIREILLATKTNLPGYWKN